jgi:hypothetical protein
MHISSSFFSFFNNFQDVIFDTSQQWWVAGTRYELRRPFFELRLSPILPGDSGRYSCRLETDPLFASGDSPMAFGVTVNVLGEP